MLNYVDAVVIGTPMQLHVPQAIQALSEGKHVLSEVTAAVSMEECWRLKDAVTRSGMTYMMAENYCYGRDPMLIQEMARKGLFGELYYGEGEYLHEVRHMHVLADGSESWRRFWQVGQRGCTYGTHSLGPVMKWFTAADPSERIDSVVCLGTGSRTVPEYPHDDTNLMLCSLKSGKLIRVRLDMVSNRPHLAYYYSLQGTNGVYEASREGTAARVWIGENRPDEHRRWRPLSEFEEHIPKVWLEHEEQARKAGHGGGDFHIGREFALSVITGSPTPIDIDTALEWTAAGLCSQVSIVNGGTLISVPEFRDASQRPKWLDG
jgi:predicted dehydrogenase